MEKTIYSFGDGVSITKQQDQLYSWNMNTYDEMEIPVYQPED